VYDRLAIMSKDSDWIVRETPEACQRILSVLDECGARHQPAAPLDVRGDYAVIGELARQLPPAAELAWTTDVDRILELAPVAGAGSARPSVRAALDG
jgi:hypothetical protein